MKKILFAAALFAAATACVSAKAKKDIFGVDFDAGFSIATGKATEIVFDNGKDYLSKVEWTTKTVPQAHMKAEIKLWNFFLDGSVSVGFPTKLGNVKDYDWTLGLIDYDCFSSHNIKNEKRVSYDFLLGYNFTAPWIYVRGGLGLAGRAMKFTAMDGSGTYLIGQKEEQEILFTGAGMDYDLKIFSPEVFIKIGCPLFKRTLGIDFAFYGAFYLPMKYKTLDNHFFRGMDYTEASRKPGFGFLAGGEFYFRRIGIFLQYEKFRNHKGSMDIRRTGTTGRVLDKYDRTGMDTSYWTVGINYRF